MPLEEGFLSLVGTNPLVQGLVGGIVIGAMNLFGALLVLVYRNPSERLLDGALGCGRYSPTVNDPVMPALRWGAQ